MVLLSCMGTEFVDAYSDVLDNAEALVSALRAVDPESVTRDNWESELAGYMDALDRLEACETELYAAIFDETSGKGRSASTSATRSASR